MINYYKDFSWRFGTIWRYGRSLNRIFYFKHWILTWCTLHWKSKKEDSINKHQRDVKITQIKCKRFEYPHLRWTRLFKMLLFSASYIGRDLILLFTHGSCKEIFLEMMWNFHKHPQKCLNCQTVRSLNVQWNVICHPTVKLSTCVTRTTVWKYVNCFIISRQTSLTKATEKTVQLISRR